MNNLPPLPRISENDVKNQTILIESGGYVELMEYINRFELEQIIEGLAVPRMIHHSAEIDNLNAYSILVGNRLFRVSRFEKNTLIHNYKMNEIKDKLFILEGLYEF